MGIMAGAGEYGANDRDIIATRLKIMTSVNETTNRHAAAIVRHIVTGNNSGIVGRRSRDLQIIAFEATIRFRDNGAINDRAGLNGDITCGVPNAAIRASIRSKSKAAVKIPAGSHGLIPVEIPIDRGQVDIRRRFGRRAGDAPRAAIVHRMVGVNIANNGSVPAKMNIVIGKNRIGPTVDVLELHFDGFSRVAVSADGSDCNDVAGTRH